ncbi:MAG: efflux RND transporter periplasmic adaptor subunit [Acidobacteriota bacterium]
MTTSACKSGYPVSARQGGGGEPRPVAVAKVAETSMENLITVTGTLAAYEEATISAKVAGRINSLNVDLGSRVSKGQVIAELEKRDAQLRLQQAEAALAQARARLGLDPANANENLRIEDTATVRQAKALLEQAEANRQRLAKLLQQGVISKSQMDQAEADYKVALSRYQDAEEEIRNRQGVLLQRKSEVDIARQQLADTTIKAAFDGMVQERIASLGEYVAAGAPVVKMVKIDPLRLQAEVPERDSRDVKQGQLVRVTVEGDTNVYSGVIKRISPAISAQNRVLIVEAEVRNNGSLKPGAFANAAIIINPNNMVVAVPADAVVTFAGIDKVITIQDGKAQEKPVTLGRRNEQWVEILNGIKAGETIVLKPGNLQTGQPVVVQQ